MRRTSFEAPAMKKSPENRLLSTNGTFFVPDGARRGRARGASHQSEPTSPAPVKATSYGYEPPETTAKPNTCECNSLTFAWLWNFAIPRQLVYPHSLS